jgi:hypothetical protein
MAVHPVGTIAYARSGDKGASANVGVIAHTQAGYDFLCELLTEERVRAFFASSGIRKVTRYKLPNLHALNFILHGILGQGGGQSLRIDAQGKSLGQQLLSMELDIPEELLRTISEQPA